MKAQEARKTAIEARKDEIENIKPWTEMTFDLAMHSIQSHRKIVTLN